MSRKNVKVVTRARVTLTFFFCENYAEGRKGGGCGGAALNS
jgi:hypothetical protein